MPRILFSFIFLIMVKTAIGGTFDFSHHDFDSKGSIPLNVKWDFYWNQLLTPTELKSYIKHDELLVPGLWNQEADYPTLGNCTYQISFILPAEHSGLSIYFPIINSAARIWINDQLLAETGNVTSDPAKFQAGLRGTIVPIPDNVRIVKLTVQVANYIYSSGGISSTPVIDRTSNILSRIERAHGVQNFFAGSLLAMFIYQLMLYFLNRDRKPYLWLALICLGVALRALIVHGGSFLLPNLYPNVSWEFWKKIEFGSVYAMVALFPSYIYHLFPATSAQRPQRIFTFIGVALLLPVLFTPHYIYGWLLEPVHGLLLITFIYAVYSVAVAWGKGNKDAKIIFFGVVASFPFIFMEIIKNSIFTHFHIQFEYLVEIGVLVFLIFQVYLLARHYALSYRKLQVSNRQLEQIVNERTAELESSNSVKDRLLSVLSHDVRSPLNSLKGILTIYNKGAIAREEFDQFARHLESDLSKTNLLVENILFWTSSQIKGVDVRIEKFDLNAITKENFELFKTIAGSKGIKLTNSIPEGYIIKSDKSIVNFVIRNLVANAIKFSRENSEVCVESEKEGKSTSIRVKDQGMGIDDKTLRTLLAPELVTSKAGTKNERGSGLGIALCKEYLEKINGEIVVDTIHGKGSTFTIVLHD